MNRDNILLCTGMPPAKAAEALAEALHATLQIHNGTPVVRRPISGEWNGSATIGGEVYHNYLRDGSAAPDEASIYDAAYDILYEISISGTIPGDARERLQHEEASKIFTEITERLPFHAVHTSEGGLIHAAWNPERGRTNFPPNTGSDPEDRDTWQPYAKPIPPPAAHAQP